MQDRYVGDVGDFGKYALLRRIACDDGSEAGNLRLGVVWYLFPDEDHNSDGRHVAYLEKEEFRALDPDLFDGLKSLVHADRRNVAAVAASRLLPVNTVFIDALTVIIPGADSRSNPNNREDHRIQWLGDCLSATEGCDLVFLDPDNGIQTASVSKRHPKAGKYAFWDEIQSYVDRGQSLVVYHHTNRTRPVSDQVYALSRDFRGRLPVGYSLFPLVFRRGSCRVFWLVLTEELVEPVRDRVETLLQSGWEAHFELGGESSAT